MLGFLAGVDAQGKAPLCPEASPTSSRLACGHLHRPRRRCYRLVSVESDTGADGGFRLRSNSKLLGIRNLAHLADAAIGSAPHDSHTAVGSVDARLPAPN